AHLALLDYVLAKAREVAGSGAAGINRGRHSRGAAEFLGIDAKRGATPVDVGVQVDEARRHDRSRNIAHLAGAAGLQLEGYLAVRDLHTLCRVEPLRGIDYPPSSKNEIVGHGSASLPERLPS